jgi:glutaconate CoA-transferase subunit A
MTSMEDLESLAARVPDGALLALAPEYSWVPMALIRALIRRRVKDLHLLTVPIGGLAADLLIGAGAVKTLESAAVSLGEAGPAPRFSEAVEGGALDMRDSTCPAIHTALQASEKGVDFMPLGGLVGSDLVDNRDDWKVVDDPLGQGGGPVVLLPAIKPDVTVFHSPRADTEGNVWIGRRRELVTMAHAAAATLVTVEAVEDRDFLDDEATAAGTLSGLYVTAIAVAEGGARPLGLTGHYERDTDYIRAYAEEAKTGDGFKRYLDREVFAETGDETETEAGAGS